MGDHNGIRHQVPSLEQTWRTHRGANRVFSFLLAVTEVNCYLAFRFFVWSDEGKIDFMTFRSRLAWSLIMNEFRDTSDPSTTRSKRKVVTETHELKSAPPHAKRWLGTKWDLTCSQDYQQHRCKWPGCKKKVRTYCLCNVGHWMCKSCFVEHVLDVETNNYVGE